MSYNLTYTTQVVGAHTYSKCVGEVVVLLSEIKVRKDTLVMPERLLMSLQLKTLIVQVIKTLSELLGKGGLQWTNGEACHGDLTSLLAEYQTYDCMEPGPPFASKAACGTFLKNIRHLLCPVVL